MTGSFTDIPNDESWRRSRSSRAAWASVRTGTGPSFAAIPPNALRVRSVTRAPRSAARKAAAAPAGPPPMIRISAVSILADSRVEIGKPAHPPEARHEAIFSAARDDEAGQPLQSAPRGPLRHGERAGAVAGTAHRISVGRISE